MLLYERHYGTLHIFVNCVGFFDISEIENIDEASWYKTMDINLKGTFFTCQKAFTMMKRQKSGSIVNFASAAGEYGSIRPGSHYAASKGSVIAMSKSLAREGAEHQIRVNVISPGPTDTQMLNAQNDAQRQKIGERTLLGRLGTPTDMSNAVLFLSSEVSSWITGDVMRVNGGSLL